MINYCHTCGKKFEGIRYTLKDDPYSFNSFCSDSCTQKYIGFPVRTEHNDYSIIMQVFKELKTIFLAKQDEYKGKTTDTFRNFNQGGELQSETPEQTLLGYVNKQIVSLFDAKHQHLERLSDVNFVNEKAGDIAVYMIILMAMVRSKQKGGDKDGSTNTDS